jgi:hypothetical protein
MLCVVYLLLLILVHADVATSNKTNSGSYSIKSGERSIGKQILTFGEGAPEPFPDLRGFCSTCGPPQLQSPDPLVRYTWGNSTNSSQLQIYRVDRPTHYFVDPPNAISGTESLSPNSTGPLKLQIRGAGALRLDWGVERAAWLEIESPDLADQQVQQGDSVKAAISEFNTPYPGKTRTLTRYGNTTYRLETNEELYEGVRFTWLFFDAPILKPWHITKISLVAKVKPVNYTGSFYSSDVGLTKTWYTGAYGSRLNMEADGFNSILIERGDRVAIQGDGHPTMAAALVAFAPFGLVKNMIDQTNSGDVHGHPVVDQSIMAYPIYWTFSVNDWFLASGDVAGFKDLAPDAMSIVDKRIDDFLQRDLDIVWFGWDDRLGNGWCFHSKKDKCTREALLAFAGLVVRACRDLGRSLRLAGMITAAQKYEADTERLTRKLHQVAEWPRGFGIHAAANAINAGVATKNETKVLFKVFNDSVNVCSWSPFNQYFILQALGNADYMDHAVASIKLCWEPMLSLGNGCFWEIFSPEWISFMADGDKAPTMPSYCHPWSSGVTSWLSHSVFQPLLPGYAEYVAAPHVSTLYPTISAVVATPGGVIAVNASLDYTVGAYEDEQIIIVTIAVVSPVPGFVGVRKRISTNCVLDAAMVLVDGVQQAVTSATGTANSTFRASSLALGNHFVPTRASALVFVRLTKSGVVSASYRGNCQTQSNSSTAHSARIIQKAEPRAGIPHIPPFPVPKYPATTDLDRTSRGDGLIKYGRDGFVLFGFDNGIDLSKLPKYIKNVTIQSHGFSGWSSVQRRFVGMSKCDPTYLPDPRQTLNKKVQTASVSSNAKEILDGCQDERALGLVHQEEQSGWESGMLLDIEEANVPEGDGRNAYESLLVDVNKTTVVPSNIFFQLSIYCVAQDDSEKHSIRVMDLESLSVIAPNGFVSDFKGGVWWSMRYDGSIRLRITGIEGISISAVAFSEGPEGSHFETKDA